MNPAHRLAAVAISDSTAAAVIGACALLVVGILALIGVLISNRRQLQAQRRDVTAIRDQVENNHRQPDGTPINLREEADERHGENTSLLRQILGTQKGMKSDIRQIRTTLDRHSEQIWDLEKTQDPKRPQRRR